MVGELPVLNSSTVTQIGGDIMHSALFYLIIGIIALDFLTGMSKAFVTGKYSSKIGLNGVVKHSSILVFIVFLKFFGRVFGMEAVTQGLVIVFFFNYLISVVENIEAMGVDFPEVVKNKFKRMPKGASNEIKVEPTDELFIRKNEGKKGVDR